MKKQVSVEYILFLKKELAKINNMDISNIEFFKNGMILEYPEEAVKEFEFTGLNNIDFITCEFYKKPRFRS